MATITEAAQPACAIKSVRLSPSHSRTETASTGPFSPVQADHRPFGSSAAVKKEIARVKESGGWILDVRFDKDNATAATQRASRAADITEKND